MQMAPLRIRIRIRLSGARCLWRSHWRTAWLPSCLAAWRLAPSQGVKREPITRTYQRWLPGNWSCCYSYLFFPGTDSNGVLLSSFGCCLPAAALIAGHKFVHVSFFRFFLVPVSCVPRHKYLLELSKIGPRMQHFFTACIRCQ